MWSAIKNPVIWHRVSPLKATALRRETKKSSSSRPTHWSIRQNFARISRNLGDVHTVTDAVLPMEPMNWLQQSPRRVSVRESAMDSGITVSVLMEFGASSGTLRRIGRVRPPWWGWAVFWMKDPRCVAQSWCGCWAIESHYLYFLLLLFVGYFDIKIKRSSCESHGRTARFECNGESRLRFESHSNPAWRLDWHLSLFCPSCSWTTVPTIHYQDPPWNWGYRWLHTPPFSSCSNWDL